jgi:hypothetical protein
MTSADFDPAYSNRGAVSRHPGLGGFVIPTHIPVESAAKFPSVFLQTKKRQVTLPFF